MTTTQQKRFADAAPLSDLLDQELAATKGQEKVSLGDLLDNAGHATYGPPMLVGALVALSPIGGLPGVGPVCGTILILFAAQVLLGRRHPWLPGFLLRWSFDRSRLAKAVRSTRDWVRRVDALIGPRWTALTRPPFVQAVAVAIIFLALTFYPLEFIPFATAAPAGAATLLALGLTARDGLLVVLGLVVTALAGWLVVAWWPF